MVPVPVPAGFDRSSTGSGRIQIYGSGRPLLTRLFKFSRIARNCVKDMLYNAIFAFYLPYQILINREPLPHMNFDVELLGDCDVIVSQLCAKLDWALPNTPPDRMESTEAHVCVPPARYIFTGAEIAPNEESCSQGDSVSEGGSESQSVVTTEDEDVNSDNYVTQMRYAMGCESRTYAENPGPSRVCSLNLPPRPHEECAWECESVGNVSVAAQMGDSREPSVENVSVCSDLFEDYMESSSLPCTDNMDGSTMPSTAMEGSGLPAACMGNLTTGSMEGGTSSAFKENAPVPSNSMS